MFRIIMLLSILGMYSPVIAAPSCIIADIIVDTIVHTGKKGRIKQTDLVNLLNPGVMHEIVEKFQGGSLQLLGAISGTEATRKFRLRFHDARWSNYRANMESIKASIGEENVFRIEGAEMDVECDALTILNIADDFSTNVTYIIPVPAAGD